MKSWLSFVLAGILFVVACTAVRPNQAGYISRQQPELMTTENVAFRPIDARMAPDGSLVIADWQADPAATPSNSRAWLRSQTRAAKQAATLQPGQAPRLFADSQAIIQAGKLNTPESTLSLHQMLSRLLAKSDSVMTNQPSIDFAMWQSLRTTIEHWRGGGPELLISRLRWQDASSTDQQSLTGNTETLLATIGQVADAITWIASVTKQWKLKTMATVLIKLLDGEMLDQGSMSADIARTLLRRVRSAGGIELCRHLPSLGEDQSSRGIEAWVDGKPTPTWQLKSIPLSRGRHRITLSINRDVVTDDFAILLSGDASPVIQK